MANEIEEQTINLAAGPIHVRSGGAGPDLLVLHHDVGTLGWTRFHEALAGRFHVFAPDMPGFGDSPRSEWARHPRDIAALMLHAARRLGLRDYLLAGLGFGGWVAAEMAAFAYPEMSGLVLAAPAGIKPEDGFILDQVMEEPATYIRAGFNDERQFQELYPDPRGRPLRDQLDLHRETIARLTWKPYMYSYELPETLRDVRLPATVVWGEADAVIPPSCAALWQAVLPDCRVELIPNGPHFLDLEYPERLAGIVANARRALAGANKE